MSQDKHQFPKIEEGRKNDETKLRYDLIPPEALKFITKVYTDGAKIYGDRNWENGMDFGRLFAATQRHLWDWWGGEERDVESKNYHLAHAAWNCIALLHYIINYSQYVEFDDRIERADK